jgi:hypothetical protein
MFDPVWKMEWKGRASVKDGAEIVKLVRQTERYAEDSVKAISSEST